MKKILIVLLVLVLLLGACTKEETSDAPTAAKEKVETKTDEKTETKTEEVASVWTEPGQFPVVNEPMEFNIFAAVFPNSAPLADNTMLKAYEEMTNVIMNWEEIPETEQTEKLSLSLASGVYPDAYFNCRISTAQQFVYGQQGVLIALNDAIDTVGVNIKQTYSDYPEIKKNSTAPDGNIYSLFQFDPAHHMSTYNKMFINTQWVEASGLGMPTTIEEFQAMLTYFRDNDMNGNGDATDEIALVGSTGVNVANFLVNPFILNVVKGYQVDDAGVVSPVFTQSEYKEALKYINGLYKEGLIGVL